MKYIIYSVYSHKSFSRNLSGNTFGNASQFDDGISSGRSFRLGILLEIPSENCSGNSSMNIFIRVIRQLSKRIIPEVPLRNLLEVSQGTTPDSGNSSKILLRVLLWVLLGIHPEVPLGIPLGIKLGVLLGVRMEFSLELTLKISQGNSL